MALCGLLSKQEMTKDNKSRTITVMTIHNYEIPGHLESMENKVRYHLEVFHCRIGADYIQYKLHLYFVEQHAVQS